MTGAERVLTEARAAWKGFRRRRTAMFFTFAFPLLLVVIFGVVVRTETGSTGGLFTEPATYYLPGYLAVVVLFTPLTRVGSTVARHREGNRFEKLATTPLTRLEWLAAHTLVNIIVVGAASVLVVVVTVGLTTAKIPLASIPVVAAAIGSGTVVFCGIGAVLGRIADSRDGVVAAANGIALPLVFLSETFVPPAMLPSWSHPVLSASPLTYFARVVRTSTYSGESWVEPGLVLVILAVLAYLLGAIALPRTE